MDWSKYFPPITESAPIHIGRLFNGIFTLCLPDGSHRTFRIATQYPGSWMEGKRCMGLLVGPHNDIPGDYEKFAFVDEFGIHVWKSLRGTQDKPSKHKEYADIIWRIASGETVEGYELLESRHCIKCNRTLTTPDAVMKGIGSTCEKAWGWNE